MGVIRRGPQVALDVRGGRGYIILPLARVPVWHAAYLLHR